MNKFVKLARGIGVKGTEYPTRDSGKIKREYALWRGMLYRCTNKMLVKYPSYSGVSCSENFKSYTFFYEWCQKQKGFENKDEKGKVWQLDKDLLVKGNKVYSEGVCCFVPQRINSLLTKSESARGEYPVGVCLITSAGKYIARCSCGVSKQKYLGFFNTPQEAFQAYKTYKEALIKQVANEYKEQLDYRVYEALMNYEVNEND